MGAGIEPRGLIGKSFLRLSLNLPPCSLHPLLLVLSSLAPEDSYQGSHLPMNHQLRLFHCPLLPLLRYFKMASLNKKG